MNVETILRTKGRAVATIGPDETVGAALDELISRNIGAIVVSKDGESVDGIISERDVVHALAAHGTDLLSLKVAEVMTQRVITCANGGDDKPPHSPLPGRPGRPALRYCQHRRRRQKPARRGRIRGPLAALVHRRCVRTRSFSTAH